MGSQGKYTARDMEQAFSKWRDMDRSEHMLNIPEYKKKVDNAWDCYAKIRDTIGFGQKAKRTGRILFKDDYEVE